MTYRCSKCNQSIVRSPGEICVTCKIKMKQKEREQDTRSNHTEMNKNENSYVNRSYSFQEESIIKEPQKSIDASKDTGNRHVGIIQNFQRREMPSRLLQRYFQSLVYGVPFTNTSVQYEFTLYPEDELYMNTHNPYGVNVVLYGELPHAFMSDSRKVEVIGRKNTNGILLAKSVRSLNSGSVIKPMRGVPASVIRFATLFLIACLISFFIYVGSFSSNEISEGTLGVLGVIGGVILLSVIGYFAIKSKSRIWSKVLLGLAILIVFMMWPESIVYGVIIIAVVYFLKRKFGSRRR